MMAIHKDLWHSMAPNQVKKNTLNFSAILSKIKFNNERIFLEIFKYSLSTHAVRAVGFGEDGDAVRVDGVLHEGRR